ncbi:MAG: hypothetical protein K2Q32_09545, partial [Alphaproteobacteria bacterium]|nr:hypothetical protein [Alphaproteobacteria bacterium]
MARIPEDPRGDTRRNRNAIVDRRHFYNQLFDAQGRPTRVMREFCGRMSTEAGDLGPEGRLAWAETVFNRCEARGHTIDYELRNHSNYSYWPKFQSKPEPIHNKEYIDIITNVCKNGTNLTCGATGNASLGVGVGRVTHKVKYERFGIETGDEKWYQTKFGKRILGVGKFIGDIVGAIGEVAAAIAKPFIEAGKWVFRGIDEALHPQAQRTPHMPAQPERGHPTAPAEHPHTVPERNPALVHRIEPAAKPNQHVWKFNMDAALKS